MKKGLLTLLIVLFATAVYADVTFSISGDAWERGDYIRNQAFLDKPEGKSAFDTSQAFYDGGFFLYPKITMDNAEINMRLAIRKQIWDSSNDAFDLADTGAATNILVDRAYLTYHFSKDSTLDVGLQEAFTWGTSFADNEGNAYRIKFAQTTPVGLFGIVLEKMAEQGDNADAPGNNYKDANDIALFAVTKAGDIWIKPLIYLLNWSSGFTTGPLATYQDSRIGYYALALNGNLGPASFESEFGYKTWHFTSVDAPLYKDPNVWGAYVNVFKALDTAKPGLTLVYDSWDKDAGLKLGNGKVTGWGFDSGNDFKSNLIFGGQGVDHENPVSVPLGENAWEGDIDGADIMAFTMIKPYIVDIKTPIPNLTASASASYMSSNQKDTMWDGAKAYEVDLGVAYQLSKYVVYSVGAGYGKCDLSTKGRTIVSNSVVPGAPPIENPDAIWAVQHMIKINF